MAVVSDTPPGSWTVWCRPWPLLFVSLGLAASGVVVGWVFGDALVPVRALLLVAGLLTAGFAVAFRLRTAGEPFEERLESAGLIALAAFTGLVAFLGLDKEWDTLQMALSVLVAVALLGVVLVLLPVNVRKVVALVLVLFHFGGMLTAATAIATPGGPAPWVSQQLWMRVYRPYLTFMYLNNAYHFYSPEPGPPALLWFEMKFAHGQTQWYKIPDRDKDPLAIHHTRLLSVTESTSDPNPLPVPPDVWEILKKRRYLAGQVRDVPIVPEGIVPLNQQYQEPREFAKEMTRSYAHHVAETHPWLDDPSNKIVSVKVYRLRHRIVDPAAVAQGHGPMDKTLFQAYFLGEFDPEGKLLGFETDGQLTYQDPFLYWLMPIYWESKDHNVPWSLDLPPDKVRLVDGLTAHAGSSPWEDDAGAEKESK